jgi:hypothetical protein
MKVILAIQKLLQGKKTYIIGLLMIILGILQDNQQLILEGLGFWTIRAGISKMSN